MEDLDRTLDRVEALREGGRLGEAAHLLGDAIDRAPACPELRAAFACVQGDRLESGELAPDQIGEALVQAVAALDGALAPALAERTRAAAARLGDALG